MTMSMILRLYLTPDPRLIPHLTLRQKKKRVTKTLARSQVTEEVAPVAGSPNVLDPHYESIQTQTLRHWQI